MGNGICNAGRVDFAQLLVQVIPLGIGAAFTPGLFAMQVLVVSGDPWRRRALAVAVGSAAAFILVGALFLLGFTQLDEVTTVIEDDFGAWLRIVSGASLWVGAVYLFRPHPALRQRAEHDISGYVGRASSWVFLGIAFALSIKDVSSFIVLAPALHDIAVAPVNVVEQAVLLLVLYALALSPVLVPPALRLVFGHRMDPVFAMLYRFTMDHQFQLVGSMAAVIGAYLLISGMLRL